MKTLLPPHYRTVFPLAAGLLLLAMKASAGNVPMTLIIGMDGSGRPVNPPVDSPASSWNAEHPWNERSLRFNEATRRVAFEIFDTAKLAGVRRRSDIDHGDTSRMAAVSIASIVFTAATAAHDPLHRDKTKELYIAEADGTGAVGLTNRTLVDGEDGILMFSAPYANGTGGFLRQTGGIIYDIQNKDHATWYPNGDWIVANVEMPVHAGLHGLAAAGTGSFGNLWAIYVRRGDPRFGKIWVQLTDWVRKWRKTGLYDPIAMAPYNASQGLCPAGAQYARNPTDVPFAYFHCSPPGEPPPVSGVMRTTIADSLLPDGNALIAFGAKVGFLRASGASTLLLARAELHLANAGIEGLELKLPSLVNVQCPLGPTVAHPDGIDTYKGRLYPGKLDLVGQLYEPWNFAPDNKRLLIASDVFASGRPGPGYIEEHTFEFMDVIEYATDGSGIRDLTAYNPAIGYGYPLNSLAPPRNTWGYWEEPAAYVTWKGRHYVAFASSAECGRGLDTWLLDLDHPKVKRITAFNDPRTGGSNLVHPTCYDADNGILYMTNQSTRYYKPNDPKDATGYGNALAPANQFIMRIGEALDNGLMN